MAMMSPIPQTMICLLLLVALQSIAANTRHFLFYELDRNVENWQRMQHMPCYHKLFKDDFQGIMSCILQSTYDAESFMVGMNASHCILCYYQVNNATLNAVEFNGTLMFRRGKLESMMIK